MGGVKFTIEGMDKLEESAKRLGKIPQKFVTQSTKKAMTPILKKARANAPYDTGDLKKGSIMVGEKSKSKAKKSYRIVFDRAMNDVFQKPNKEGKVTGYYPVSQEYGYYTKSGSYIPGFRFISGAFTGQASQVEKTIITEMENKMEAAIAKEGLK